VTAGSASRAGFLGAVGLLVALVVVELAAGLALTSASGPASTGALSVPGVAAMDHGAPVDPAEITQVAASRHPHRPLAPAALAMVDGLVLVTLAFPARRPALVGRLAVLLGAMAVTVSPCT
jgi:hypothetical protein